MKTRIILHHTGDTSKTPQFKKVERFHDAGAGGKWPKGHGIMYHFFIERIGTIIHAKDEDEHLWQAGDWFNNSFGIAICLAGNFLVDDPTYHQLKSLSSLLTDIQKRRGIRDSNVYLHWEVRRTECPGKDLRKLVKERFPDKTLEQKIKQVKKAIPRAKDSRKRRLLRLLKRLLRQTK